MYERMLNKKTRPSPEELAAWCGEAGALFKALNEWLRETYASGQTIEFPYGNKYGWGIAHRKKKKLVCHVFAEAGAFTLMIRLTDAQFAAVYGRVQEYTRAYIDGKYPCGDGGWIHYRVVNPENLDDARTLLSAKCAP